MADKKNTSLSDDAYRYILEKIITFEYNPSEPIVEAELCETLKISRTPLREALQRLEAEGFVTKARNRGTFVRAYTVEDIRESCDIRKLFELYSLKNCIRSVSKGELMEIRSSLEKLDENSQPEEYYRLDSRLHGIITRYCMNSRMLSILANLSVQLDAFQKISAQTPHRLLESRDEHLKIVDAIAAGNLKTAERVLGEHLDNVKDSSIRAFQKLRAEKMGI